LAGEDALRVAAHGAEAATRWQTWALNCGMPDLAGARHYTFLEELGKARRVEICAGDHNP
jgi:hypothetical protein